MTDRLDLPIRYRNKLEALLREHVPDVEVWAYGSRVNGQNHEGSDLDLALRSPTLERLGGEYLELIDALEQSNIPILVQVHDWARLPESFHKEIERDYVVVQEPRQEKGCPKVEWGIATIDEIAKKVAMGPFGSSIKVKTFVPEGVPIISGHHLHGLRVADSPGFNFITPEHAKRLANANVRRGDIVFTHRGNIGQVAYIPEDSRYDHYIVSQSQFYMRCDLSKAIPEFVTMFFKSAEGQHQLLANTSQVGVPSIAQPVTYLRTINIPLPPLREQRAIAHILGTLDDKIELNRRMNETLETMARALFKSWFVDFDPVRAKMEGRWRKGESLPGLSSKHYDLFPDQLVPSEHGEIPEGWEVKALGDIIEIYDSKRVPLNSSQRAKRQGSYPYYGAAGIMDYVDDYLFDGVYVLIGEDGSVVNSDGHPVVQYIWGQFWVNNHAHVLKGTNQLSEEHLYLLLQQLNILPFVTGAVQPKLSQRNLKAVPIIFPGWTVCSTFSGLIAPLFEKVRNCADESKPLVTLRDTLLSKLVRGEVQVSETDHFPPGEAL